MYKNQNANLISSHPVACVDLRSGDSALAFDAEPPMGRISLRSQKLMGIILSEVCLPIGLRSVLAEEWSDLQKLLKVHVCGFHAIEWKVNALVLTLGWCREVCANDQLVSQMKLLGMELTAYLDSLQDGGVLHQNAG
jgi:hypothetical protein